MGTVQNAIEKVNKDKTRLMDVLIDIQESEGCVSAEAINEIAAQMGISSVDVKQTLSFYHFFTTSLNGKYTVYLNDSAVAEMMGRDEVAAAFEEAAGINFGETTPDGNIGLFNTACIGMNDQEPAAIINNKVFTNLTPEKATSIISDMKSGKSIEDIAGNSYGDGQNSNPLINSMVNNNIIKEGAVIFADYSTGSAIESAIGKSQDDVINEIKNSNLRGRGGAGFPTGMKWDFCKRNIKNTAYIFCNADEGEPGTFKDRVILTEKPEMIFEGMAVAAYAVGATKGLLYIRYEYKYMEQYLEKVLEDLRAKNILGNNIKGKNGFNFDIRIQFGAGAYVCGEESALIESAEGKRGEPRDRPPFPVEVGYLDKPTVVNNIETLCSVTRIMEKGAEWFKSCGSKESTGTKLLSISGDCQKPGVYEIDWGITIKEMLDMVGASDVQAVQVGGPSGSLIGPNEFNRAIAYEDLPTGGSMIVVGKNRDILTEVVLNFTDFFIEESCGSCVPCRAMSILMRQKLVKIIEGKGIKQDIEELVQWGNVMKINRCGLGQTAANPILTSIKNFRNLYEEKIQQGVEYDTGFDIEAAVKDSCEVVGRIPNL